MSSEKIRAIYFFEMLGKPPEYVKQSLEEFLTKLDGQKGIRITSKKIHEPKQIEKEGEKDFFTTFAEVEVELDNLSILFKICFHMLPSHVEILAPDELRLKNFELGNIISDLAIKLHRYDEIAKVLTLEKKSLVNQLGMMQEKALKNSLRVEEIVGKEEKKEEKEKRKTGKKKGNFS